MKKDKTNNVYSCKLVLDSMLSARGGNSCSSEFINELSSSENLFFTSNISYQSLIFNNKNIEELLSIDNGISFYLNVSNVLRINNNIINHLLSKNISLINDDLNNEIVNTQNNINDLSSILEDNKEPLSTCFEVDMDKSQNIKTPLKSIRSNSNYLNQFEKYFNSLKQEYAFDNITASLIGYGENTLEINEKNI